MTEHSADTRRTPIANMPDFGQLMQLESERLQRTHQRLGNTATADTRANRGSSPEAHSDSVVAKATEAKIRQQAMGVAQFLRDTNFEPDIVIETVEVSRPRAMWKGIVPQNRRHMHSEKTIGSTRGWVLTSAIKSGPVKEPYDKNELPYVEHTGFVLDDEGNIHTYRTRGFGDGKVQTRVERHAAIKKRNQQKEPDERKQRVPRSSGSLSDIDRGVPLVHPVQVSGGVYDESIEALRSVYIGIGFTPGVQYEEEKAFVYGDGVWGALANLAAEAQNEAVQQNQTN